MFNKKNIIYNGSFFLIVTVLVITIVGRSFAYFSIVYELGDSYEMGGSAVSGEPFIEFQENKTGIILNGAYPMTDEVGYDKSDEYEFTVTSKENTKNVKVNVYLQVAENNTLADDLVNISYNDFINNLSLCTTESAIDQGFDNAYNLGSFILKPNELQKSRLRIWVNENGTIDNALNKRWTGKIVVIPEFTLEEPIEVVEGSLAEHLIFKANRGNINNYNLGNKKELFSFRQLKTEQTDSLIDYRFIGNDPNNYLTFNDEVWRIIGVFAVLSENGKMEWRVKIIRNNSIGKLAWNANTENAEYKNIWFKGTLYELLNSGDYYNRVSNYAETGLNETAKNQIGSVKWYLGNSNTGRTFSASVAYEMERGTKRCIEPSDGSVNCFSDDSTVNVMDKVGLMYPSDYL